MGAICSPAPTAFSGFENFPCSPVLHEQENTMLEQARSIYFGIRTAASLAGNTIGFLLLMAGSWLGLQFLGAVIQSI